jgi:hypothetical protein
MKFSIFDKIGDFSLYCETFTWPKFLKQIIFNFDIYPYPDGRMRHGLRNDILQTSFSLKKSFKVREVQGLVVCRD